MLVQVLAALVLAFVLLALTRFALGLRAAQAAREAERRAQQAQGRRVVAELPVQDDVILFLEGSEGFYWGADEARKSELRGARLVLNGVALQACAAAGFELPPLVPAGAGEFDDGREHYSVRLYLAGGRELEVPCGRLREGVSREAAGQAFQAVRAALAG